MTCCGACASGTVPVGHEREGRFPFAVVNGTTALRVVIGVVIVAFDLQAWRIVAPMFDRERLITGTRS